ncbi:hypothetical protein [Fibrella forsythiae]|uniref:Phage tail protein n=1 Tax=Fibrella forsythiae TaxID=2817061 RepID=A0ABS3JAB8_9BACT|nr:hypothetical protein [Fibrella forsythiae]MBO0946954.1 hypothetical protein [Fibrella forsythiae]
MAIVIHEQPASRALLGSGQTQFTFYGDERMLASGVAAVNRVSLVQMAEGDQAKLTWNGNELTLIAKNAPSGPHEIPTGSANVNNTAYLDQLLPYLRDLYLIRQDFTVEIETTAFLGFWLTAKAPGPAYNFTEKVVFLKQSINNLSPGRSATIRPRYGVHVTLRVQRPGTTGLDMDAHYESVFVSPIETNEDGFASLDVAPLLEGYLTSSYPDITPRLDETAHRQYYIEYAEAYGDPIQVGRVSRSATFHIYRGGASIARQAKAGYSLEGFVRQPGRKDYALRLGSLRRYIAPDSIQFLTFLNVGGTVASVALQVTAGFDKGLSQTRTDLVTPMAWPASGLLTYAVGPDQLGLPALMTSVTLGQYTVSLVNAITGELLSDAYSFVLDYAVRPYPRQFAYVNSLGALDVITTWGKGSTEYELASQQAQRSLSLPFAADEGTGEVYEQTYQEKLSVATGFRPLPELKAWRDFYRSTQKWWLKRPLNRLAPDARIPVTLLTTSIRETKDGENLVAHTFEVAHLRKEHYYSPEDDVLDDPLPPKGFAPVGTVVVTQTTVVQARDQTIPDALRGLSGEKIEAILKVVTWGNPDTKGFLKQGITDQLYRAAEDPVPVSQVAGLAETVYTRAEADQQARQQSIQLIQTQRIRARAIPMPS